jgi:hypothetical protein
MLTILQLFCIICGQGEKVPRTARNRGVHLLTSSTVIATFLGFVPYFVNGDLNMEQVLTEQYYSR